MDDAGRVFNKALRYLSYRPRSEKEVVDYLLNKNKPQKKDKTPISSEIIEAVLQKLREMRFVNDREFASNWVRSRKTYKMRSVSVMKMELRQKGISQELIDEVLQSRSEKIDDKILARSLLEKRRKRYELMERPEQYQKAGGYLARKGFDFETIKRAIDEVFGKKV